MSIAAWVNTCGRSGHAWPWPSDVPVPGRAGYRSSIHARILRAVSGAGTNCTRSDFGRDLISPTISSSSSPGTFHVNCSGVRRDSALSGTCTVTPSAGSCGS